MISVELDSAIKKNAIPAPFSKNRHGANVLNIEMKDNIIALRKSGQLNILQITDETGLSIII